VVFKPNLKATAGPSGS